MDCIWLGQDMEVGEFGRKRTLSRPGRKWNDIIEIEHKKM